MTCKFCGNVIEDNSDICFICGQKVEAAPAADATADAFAPVAPVAPVYAEAPAAPVYAEAPAAPVYAAAPVAPVAPAAPVVDIKAQKKALKAAKKAAKASKGKKGGKSGNLSIGRVIITALIIALIFAVKSIALYLIIAGMIYAIFAYRSYNKAIAAGNTDAANKLVNSLMVGACLGMAAACVALIGQSFFPSDAAAEAASTL